jgi:uncharacterized protein (DUF1499 family)
MFQLSFILSSLITAMTVRLSQCISQSSRRGWFIENVLILVPVAASANDGANLPLQQKFCSTVSDPFKTTKICTRYGLDKRGGLRPVAADENGVSCSSVRSPSKFSPPWDYRPGTFDANEAWKSLKRVIIDTEGVELKDIAEDGYYVHATVPSAFPEGSLDDLEFTLNPIEKVVLYRSVSRTSIFPYPFQQPISDRGSNLKRLEDIRNRLGWSKLIYDVEGTGGY